MGGGLARSPTQRPMRKSETGVEETHGLEVMHAIPGRTRLRWRRLKGDSGAAREIHRRLSAIDGIHQVEVNPNTGSVIVHHEPEAMESLEFLLAVAAAFGLGLGETEELSELLKGLEQGAELTDLTKDLSKIGEEINARLAKATGGQLDMRTALPLVLALLGIRSLIVSDVLTSPKWYDYLWFAFGSYFILNPSYANVDHQP